MTNTKIQGKICKIPIYTQDKFIITTINSEINKAILKQKKFIEEDNDYIKFHSHNKDIVLKYQTEIQKEEKELERLEKLKFNSKNKELELSKYHFEQLGKLLALISKKKKKDDIENRLFSWKKQCDIQFQENP